MYNTWQSCENTKQCFYTECQVHAQQSGELIHDAVISLSVSL